MTSVSMATNYGNFKKGQAFSGIRGVCQHRWLVVTPRMTGRVCRGDWGRTLKKYLKNYKTIHLIKSHRQKSKALNNIFHKIKNLKSRVRKIN